MKFFVIARNPDWEPELFGPFKTNKEAHVWISCIKELNLFDDDDTNYTVREPTRPLQPL